ncbi:MAG TPA: hypothetical protein VFZ37_07655 [Jiangellaceae bacterium]
MSKGGKPVRLDPAQARRMLGALSLRPNERVLCLGPAGGALPGVAAILVGPSGHIAEADPAALTGRTLPYPDGEFDAVAIDLSALDPKQTNQLLAEVARVTTPTGRVTYAVPRLAGGNPAPAQQAQAAGLRGVAIRTDPGADHEGVPVEFVTAFPPVPAEPGADTETTAQIHLREPAANPAQPRRRRQVLAGSVAALVGAAAVAVVWSLAGADRQDGGSDLLARGAELDVDPPGADGRPADDNPLADGGQQTDDTDTNSASTSETGAGSSSGSSDSGSSSNTGSESDSTGGGEPVNQPPVIEDMGLSVPGPEGLALLIEPIVSDPDGDEVSVAIEVDGEPLQIADPAGPRIMFRFSYDEVGETHDATVTVIATDTLGNSSQRTETHQLVAKYYVRVAGVLFRITNTADCFADDPRRSVTGSIRLSGAVEQVKSFSTELRQDRPETELFGTLTAIRQTPPSQRLTLEIEFEGESRSYDKVHSTSDQVARLLTSPNAQCRGWLLYKVTFHRI